MLIADDDFAVRSLMAFVLQGAGFFVRCAEDGFAAWQALREESFHLLISDHEMPQLSGVELLRRVRTSQLRLPFILVSGRLPRNETAFRSLLEPGLTMEKPFTGTELLANVHTLLGRHSAAASRTSPTSSLALERGRTPESDASGSAAFPTRTCHAVSTPTFRPQTP